MFHVQTHLSEACSLALGSEQSRDLWPQSKCGNSERNSEHIIVGIFFFITFKTEQWDPSQESFTT